MQVKDLSVYPAKDQQRMIHCYAGGATLGDALKETQQYNLTPTWGQSGSLGGQRWRCCRALPVLISM